MNWNKIERRLGTYWDDIFVFIFSTCCSKEAAPNKANTKPSQVVKERNYEVSRQRKSDVKAEDSVKVQKRKARSWSSSKRRELRQTLDGMGMKHFFVIVHRVRSLIGHRFSHMRRGLAFWFEKELGTITKNQRNSTPKTRQKMAHRSKKVKCE